MTGDAFSAQPQTPQTPRARGRILDRLAALPAPLQNLMEDRIKQFADETERRFLLQSLKLPQEQFELSCAPPPQAPTNHWVHQRPQFAAFSQQAGEALETFRLEQQPFVEGFDRLMARQRNALASVEKTARLRVDTWEASGLSKLEQYLTQTFGYHHWSVYAPLQHAVERYGQNVESVLAICHMGGRLHTDFVARLPQVMEAGFLLHRRLLRRDDLPETFLAASHFEQLLTCLTAAGDALAPLSDFQLDRATKLFIRSAPALIFFAPERVCELEMWMNSRLPKAAARIRDRFCLLLLAVPLDAKAPEPLAGTGIAMGDWLGHGLDLLQELEGPQLIELGRQFDRLCARWGARRLLPSDRALLVMALLLNRKPRKLESLGHGPITYNLATRVDHLLFFLEPTSSVLFCAVLLSLMERLDEGDGSMDTWTALSELLVSLVDRWRAEDHQGQPRRSADHRLVFSMLSMLAELPPATRVARAQQLLDDSTSGTSRQLRHPLLCAAWMTL